MSENGSRVAENLGAPLPLQPRAGAAWFESTRSLEGKMADQLDRDFIVGELARAIGAIAHGRDEEARTIVSDLARVLAATAQADLPGIPAAAPAIDRETLYKAACSRLFAYWQERCAHRAAKMTPERARAIIARLRDGYTETEIRKAIDGAAESAYVNETTGQKYDDLTLICRNGSKLEDFIARGVTATGEVIVEVTNASPIEEQISDLRRRMSELKREGRETEYKQAAEELRKLMARRG